MGISVASDLETTSRPRGGGFEKLAIFAAKLIVTGGCFWYVSRQIDLRQALSAVPLLDFRWAAFAIFVVVLQIPLLGVRWCNILDALAVRTARVTAVATIAVSAIGVFFAQVLPSVAGEGVRAWLLVRLGCDWRSSVTSVVIDRGVGVGLLIAIGFGILLLLPSGLTALGGYREVVLVFYGAMLLAAAFGLVFAPTVAPWLSRWRYSRWFATLAVDARRVLLGLVRPDDSGHRMSRPCPYHRRHLVAWTRARPAAAGLGCGDPVHGHDQRGVGSDLDRRLGSARGRRDLAAGQSRRSAR